MAVNYEVAGIINPVDQGNSNLCWLAATATLLSWKLVQYLDLKATAKYLGPEFELLLTSGDALSASDIPLFLRKSKLIAKAGASRPPKVWESLLKTNGLLGVGVDADKPDNYMAHLIVIQGIKGDETLDNTTVKMIDPNGGKKANISFRAFGKMYGANDATLIPFNVFHCA